MSADVALVAGGAGGIGRAIVSALLASGRQVVALDRAADGLARLRDDHPEVVTVEGDSSVEADANAAAERAAALGSFCIAVVCTGIVDRASILRGSADQWADVLRVNVVSALLAGQMLKSRLTDDQTGDLVVIGSVSGRIHYQGEPAYLASKHATSAAMEVLRQELVGTATRVTVVQPGLVETPLTSGVQLPDGIRSNFVPLAASDVASAVMFALCAPRNVVINEIVMRPMGQVL